MCLALTPLAMAGVSTGLNAVGAISRNIGERKAAATQDAYNQARYQQQLKYAQQQQEYQNRLVIQQNRYIADNAENSIEAFIRDNEAISSKLIEEELASKVQLEEVRMERLRAVGAIQASEKTGRSVSRLINDFYAQEGRYQAITTRNNQLLREQSIRERRAAEAQMRSRINEAREYIPAPIQLPTEPQRTPRPSLLSTALQIGGSALDSYNRYLYKKVPAPNLREDSFAISVGNSPNSQTLSSGSPQYKFLGNQGSLSEPLKGIKINVPKPLSN